MATIQPKTALYRIYDSDDTLLYVGISHMAMYRLETHMARQPWAAAIRRVLIDWHESREAAASAEVAAIVTERPLHNVLHAGRGCRHEWLGITDKPKARTRSFYDHAHASQVRRPLIGTERYECSDCGKQLRGLPQ